MTSEIGVFKFKSYQFISNSHNAFVYINSQDFKCKISSSESEIVPVKLRYGTNFENVFYTSLGPLTPQVSPGCLAMCPFTAKELKIKDEEQILLSLSSASGISVAYVHPKTNDDYQIMVNLQYILENSVMDQVRVVAPGQMLSLKVGNISVNLVTDSFTPSGECGRLEKFTQFVVLNEEEKYSNKEKNPKISEKPSLSQQFWNILHWGAGSSMPESVKSSNAPLISSLLKSAISKRVILDYKVLKEELNFTDIVFTNSGFKTDMPTPCKISKMPEKTALIGNAPKLDEYYIYSLVQNKVTQCESFCRLIYLNSDIMKKLDVVVGSRVYIEELAELPIKGKDASKLGDAKDVDKSDIEEKVSKRLVKPVKAAKNTFLWQSFYDLKDRLTKIIPGSLKMGEGVNAIITAPIGCGKTFILETLHERFEEENLFCNFVACKELRGKKIESLMKLLTAKWSECAYREPSVLFLDDIDALMIQDEQEEVEAGQGAVYSRKLANLLSELNDSFQNRNRICVIATATNLKNVTNAMAATRGPRLFDMVLNIPDINATEREKFLNYLGLEVNDDVIERTQGFRVQDLFDLAGRAKLNAALSETGVVSLEDVEKALDETIPLGLHGVRLHKDFPYTWDDVGGMEPVKKVLDEIFRWPSQFPQVFETCPLRLQSGALLFGPPGCGKTLVAGALANECGMNFISVKGPEVLSKYVGASEAAVRDLFSRAGRAQPCLLFFDELDSLAPRRGLDTTGVTDRVVNQLLTQLDGVESRTGVWILAASSRPDLVDPALLRPGRLDRIVLCPLPGQDDREQIIRVLAKKVTLAGDVDFKNLAKLTENFSGADLQALLYNSQMKAIQAQTNDENDDELTISLEHIEAALHETKPSLSKSELLKYDLLYKRIMNTKGPKGDRDPPLPQKVTFM